MSFFRVIPVALSESAIPRISVHKGNSKMTDTEKSTFSTLIGDKPTRKMIFYISAFIRYGICKREDELDLAHDFLLVCLKAISNQNKRASTDSAYLCRCIRHAAGRFYIRLKRHHDEAVAWETAIEKHKSDGDEAEVSHPFINLHTDYNMHPVWQGIDYETVREAVQRLPRAAREIMLFTLENGSAVTMTCLAFGKPSNFYQRKILPQLKKMLLSEISM